MGKQATYLLFGFDDGKRKCVDSSGFQFRPRGNGIDDREFVHEAFFCACRQLADHHDFTNEFAMSMPLPRGRNWKPLESTHLRFSVIKAEQQIRRLFTHMVFQCPAFGYADIPAFARRAVDEQAVLL